jgi:hypothetical protein
MHFDSLHIVLISGFHEADFRGSDNRSSTDARSSTDSRSSTESDGSGGRAVLADFGTARVDYRTINNSGDTHIKTKEIVGTAPYMVRRPQCYNIVLLIAPIIQASLQVMLIFVLPCAQAPEYMQKGHVSEKVSFTFKVCFVIDSRPDFRFYFGHSAHIHVV